MSCSFLFFEIENKAKSVGNVFKWENKHDLKSVYLWLISSEAGHKEFGQTLETKSSIR
jgi:hypothetical protein